MVVGTTSAIPEPNGVVLLSIAGIGSLMSRRRQRLKSF
ncbi:MAG: PEP-CTERM sorting domain-containing protein [Akkermansiaceae bacterium]